MRSCRNALLILTVLTVLAAFSPVAVAARLPRWAREIQPVAIPDDGVDLDTSFRVLFLERKLSVLEDGTFLVRDRIAKQALSRFAKEVGTEYFALHPGAYVIESRAWHVAPGKRTRKSKERDAVSIGDPGAFLSDRKALRVSIQGIREGSLVFFEFKTRWRPYSLAFSHRFANSELVDISRFLLDLPEGWSARHSWLNGAGVESEETEDGLVWQMTDLAFPSAELLAPPLAERAPVLLTSIEAPAGSSFSTPGFTNWSELGEWYESLSEGRDELREGAWPEMAPPEAGLGESGLDYIVACAEAVRDRVRYVAQAIGIGGYQPRAAGQTLGDLWGDCKDKSTLLKALLSRAGIESYLVLVDATWQQTISPDLPMLSSFNHAVLAVSLPQGVELPEAFRVATLEDDQLGTLLLVDATQEHCSIGAIPAGLSGKTALVIAGENSHLLALPGGDPRDHRVEAMTRIVVHPDSAMTFRATVRSLGELAIFKRALHDISAADFRRAAEREIHEHWIGAEITGFEVTSEDPHGAFVEIVSWKLPARSGSPEAAKLAPFPGAFGAVPSVPTKRRRVGVRIPFPHSAISRVRIEGVAVEGVLLEPLPSGLAKAGSGWTLSREFRQEGDLILGQWSVSVSKTLFPVEDLPGLRSLYRGLRSIAATAIAIP